MTDVVFPKRPPTPRELDSRPIPSDYRPKKLRLLESGEQEDEAHYAEEAQDESYSETPMLPSPVSLPKLGDLPKPGEESGRNRLNEIAGLMRTLTYGEMMELAHAIWKIRPDKEEVDQYSLPMMLHLWSTSLEQ
jgi:hypothetical protein